MGFFLCFFWVGIRSILLHSKTIQIAKQPNHFLLVLTRYSAELGPIPGDFGPGYTLDWLPANCRAQRVDNQPFIVCKNSWVKNNPIWVKT